MFNNFYFILIGSLYDLWGQDYIVMGSKENAKYFTRVALGAYANPMLYVNDLTFIIRIKFFLKALNFN